MPPHNEKPTHKDEFFERGRQLLQDAENSTNPEIAKLRARAANRYFDADLKGGSQMNANPIGPAGPLEILKLAIKAVPAVKYALAVGGIVAVIVIIIGFKVDLRIAVFGTVIMLVLMTAVVAFAHLAKESASTFRTPALLFMWFSVVLTMASALAVFLSVFAGWPLDWRGLVAAQSQNKSSAINTERWQVIEGEFSNQFNNMWDVRFDGKPFPCAPSPTYGETLCTAIASGNERVVKRFVTTDNNPCTFEGTVNDKIITGKYSCTRVKGPFDWHATIIQ